jgi:hypothetical protein
MGVDGENILHIRGPSDDLDKMEAVRLFYTFPSGELQQIAVRFFGSELLKVQRHTENYLVITYTYRNLPVYQYLSAVISLYPKCYMKNEFCTDQGIAGVWLARFVKGALEEQEVAWIEPSLEELAFSTDFSC